VLGYALYTDNATSQATWTELAGYSTLYSQTSFIFDDYIQAGQTYYFKVFAKNKWGWGPESTVSSILAATTPSKVLNVATAIDSTTGGVQITWNEPAQLGGISLDSYTIEIKGQDTSWRTDSSCDGTNTTIRDSRSCIIPMATLSSSPHSLAFDTLIEVRVTANNQRGAGETSDINTSGARIRQEPAQMSPPTEGGLTSDSQL